jgi:hypothetical protein
LLVKIAPERSKTAKETKLFTPSGGNITQSQPQVDKLRDAEHPNVLSSEPWTGKWRVHGPQPASGLWVLKQDGQMVVSTDASYFDVRGAVTENRLEGTYTKNLNNQFGIVISPDGKSFEGHVTHRLGSGPIQGARIE